MALARPTSKTPPKLAPSLRSAPWQKNITEVVFDRAGFIYHGKVKALADAAREKGLKF